MAEERRDNSIYVLGIIIALALIFYGLWTEEHPVAIEIVELIKNKTVEFLDPKVITRVNKEIVNLTATPGTSLNAVIYATPAGAQVDQVATIIAEAGAGEAGTVIAEAEATLRALTPIAPSATPEPSATMYLPPAASTLAPMPATATQVPVVPTTVPPTVPPVPTTVPPTVPPVPTTVPPTVPPVPTTVPPTVPPAPTTAPPTWTPMPPTWTPAPPTWTPTQVPTVPPVPTPTLEPTASPTFVIYDLVNGKEGNPELPPTSGSATLQGNITGGESGQLTMILTNGDYYQAMVVGSGGNFSFPNVPNGTYNLSVNQGSAGAGCAEITVSVPEGHTTLTYNYRYYKRQCGN